MESTKNSTFAATTDTTRRQNTSSVESSLENYNSSTADALKSNCSSTAPLLNSSLTIPAEDVTNDSPYVYVVSPNQYHHYYTQYLILLIVSSLLLLTIIVLLIRRGRRARSSSPSVHYTSSLLAEEGLPHYSSENARGYNYVPTAMYGDDDHVYYYYGQAQAVPVSQTRQSLVPPTLPPRPSRSPQLPQQLHPQRKL